MKESNIIFTGPMVRALLVGNKTQTSRVMKRQPDEDGLVRLIETGEWHDTSGRTYRFPYGQPGDRLWVREAWNTTLMDDLAPGESIGKPAADCHRDNKHSACACADGVVYKADGVTEHPFCGKPIWRLASRMPRWASRITLEITDVSVQRVQEISEADALAEGIVPAPDGHGWHTEDGCHYAGSPVLAYASLFEQIYGPGTFEANRWVWRISFRRIEQFLA